MSERRTSDRLAVVVHAVTGPPGAGKSTALIGLAEQCVQIARFGVRDHALRLANQGNPLGLQLRDTLLGDSVRPTDQVTNHLVRRGFAHFLACLPAEVSTVLVDGYPRNLGQCADLVRTVTERIARLGTAIVFDIPDAVVATRIRSRRICGVCGLPITDPIRATCRLCGGSAERRADDHADAAGERLAGYRFRATQIQSYFAERTSLAFVDGQRSPAAVVADVRRLIGDPERSTT
jgi:adenylate kinase